MLKEEKDLRDGTKAFALRITRMFCCALSAAHRPNDSKSVYGFIEQNRRQFDPLQTCIGRRSRFLA